MIFKDITIIDEDMNVQEHSYVGIKDDRIAYIGRWMPQGDWGREIEGRGRLLMSGFYNAHAHSPMMLMRGYGENLMLMDWLTTKIFPFEDHLYHDAVYWSTMLAMAESFQYGIVSTTDMYFFCDDMVKAFLETGAKGNIARTIANDPGEDPAASYRMKEAEKFFKDFHMSGDGRIRVDMSLHGEYTSDAPNARYLAQMSRDLGARMHVHVSETKFEHDECIRKYGMTPSAYLNDCGLFDVPTTAAHCVWSTDEDLEIYREKGVTVAANPVSNMKLASGICRTGNVLSHGVKLAIGTDSVASNNSLNFMEEIKLMAIGSKTAQQDPTVVTPVEALTAATYGGASSQGREDCGKLKKGFRADLIMMDISKPNMHPVHSLLNNLVYSASGSDIMMTVIDGKVVYDNGQFPTLDIERVIAEVDKAKNNILERL